MPVTPRASRAPSVASRTTRRTDPDSSTGLTRPRDAVTDVVRWGAFSSALVPVVLLVCGSSPAGALGTAAGLATVTVVCRALLRRAERTRPARNGGGAGKARAAGEGGSTGASRTARRKAGGPRSAGSAGSADGAGDVTGGAGAQGSPGAVPHRGRHARTGSGAHRGDHDSRAARRGRGGSDRQRGRRRRCPRPGAPGAPEAGRGPGPGAGDGRDGGTRRNSAERGGEWRKTTPRNAHDYPWLH
ncbi:hypothetical protein SCA03_39460 [Streptomyces cacaoi]|uniref:Uncharacterized protein n=2 Tax=Streptomyces cacaoi TaxID=1898 RepID=A0A4Y3R119_STRCI|nr:hypothetical protein SCA03_39460 [Streptomyces cacaoi]